MVSSVLYLTRQGGPTVVLDQTPEETLADRGWVAQPCPNQLLAFPGNLLHGVLPGVLRTVQPVFCKSGTLKLQLILHLVHLVGCHLKPAYTI